MAVWRCGGDTIVVSWVDNVMSVCVHCILNSGAEDEHTKTQPGTSHIDHLNTRLTPTLHLHQHHTPYNYLFTVCGKEL